MKNPEISVILPFHNAESTLKTAVESIVSQTFQNWELILVNDGSTDDSEYTIQNFAVSDSRINIITQQHSGIVGALNNGIQLSKAALIARMDADDVSYPQRLGKQINYLDEHPDCGLVSCLVDFGGDEKTAGGYEHYVHWINSIHTNQDIRLNRFAESPIAHPSVTFRKNILDKIGMYRDGDFPEDYELWLRMMEHDIRFAKVSESLLLWNDPPERLSRNHPKYSTEAFYRIKSRYLLKWLARNNPFHPRTVILGSGRVTRKRVKILQDAGLVVSHYVDVNPNKIGNQINGIPVISIDELSPDDAFLISMLGGRDKSKQVRTTLWERNFIEGTHYIISA